MLRDSDLLLLARERTGSYERQFFLHCRYINDDQRVLQFDNLSLKEDQARGLVLIRRF